MNVFTVGHGTRPLEELVEMLVRAGVRTLLDVRRFPGSRRNPQFNQPPLQAALGEAGVTYRHAVELGGRLSNESGAERFDCIRIAAFRSYAARMGTAEWQEALARELERPAPCFMCAETPPSKCHRRFIAELLLARGYTVIHLLGPHRYEHHRPFEEAEVREGRLYLCGQLVA